MAIGAHIDETPQADAAQRREPRRRLQLSAVGSTESAGEANVLIHNISATGLLLESRVPLVVEERIEIDLPLAGPTGGRVIWASGLLYGCEFDEAVSAAVLSAAQLRSPGESQLNVASTEAGSTESFGLRFRRLRKGRGLTLAAVAEAVGVSKPTVWAWENGKARPAQNRMAPLAELLEIPADELAGGRSRADLRELVARCREQIASAAGVSQDTVRILIEL